MKHYKINNVLFVSPSFSSFIEKDYQILRAKYRVKNVVYSHRCKKSLLSLIPRIIGGVLWADLTFIWFGSFHAFFAILFSKLMQKKSIVVAGGYDVAKMPEIDYGLINMKLWRLFSIFSFRFCDRILAVSQHTKREIIKNLNLNEKKIEVIHHGFDKNRFCLKGTKENVVITVAEVNSRTLLIKGLTNFAKTAKLLPDTRFYLVGRVEDRCREKLRSINAFNLFYTGYVPHEEIASVMQRAKVYVQISANESFGCSIAEAMLCGCIPVVTACGALPEVVGDIGYYVPYGDIETTAKAVKRALKDGDAQGEKARKKIEEEFPIEKRQKKLIEVISRLQRK